MQKFEALLPYAVTPLPMARREAALDAMKEAS
jgi:hypothetical protein